MLMIFSSPLTVGMDPCIQTLFLMTPPATLSTLSRATRLTKVSLQLRLVPVAAKAVVEEMSLQEQVCEDGTNDATKASEDDDSESENDDSKRSTRALQRRRRKTCMISWWIWITI
jgi:hypothetical protein